MHSCLPSCRRTLVSFYNPVRYYSGSTAQLFYPIRFISEKTLIKNWTALINPVWMSISDPVEFFSKSSPNRVRFWIAESGWIAIRTPRSWSKLMLSSNPIHLASQHWKLTCLFAKLQSAAYLQDLLSANLLTSCLYRLWTCLTCCLAYPSW